MKGFVNLGNTCYMNSALQMILRIDNFKQLFQSLNLQKNNLSNEELEEIKTLIDFNNKYHYSNEKILNPNEIKNLIGKKNKKFLKFNQEDSEEFINYLLDFIYEKLKKFGNKEITQFEQIIESRINKAIKCKAMKCLTVSNTVEKMNLINLSLTKETDDLDSCLKELLKREKLENDSMYFCDNCKKLRIASKRLEFKSLPSDIIFSIKRYSSSLRKIDKKIDMPLEWKDYRLKGIVFHSGSFGGGHYIYIGMDNNRWYIFNDSFVSEINNMSSLDQYKNHGYLYHYTRK